MFNLTDNQKERLAYVGNLFSNGFKVLVSCMLSIFVPQYCENPEVPGEGTTCTFQQNFENLTPFNAFVIGFNFFTLVLFVRMYFIESKREFYFIKQLDNNPEFADNYLETALKPVETDNSNTLYTKAKISDGVHHLNNKYHSSIKWSIVTFVLNAIFSSVLIFYFFYDGFRSVSSMITNLLLISSKLYKDWSIMSDGKNKLEATSTSMSEPIKYNTIDSKVSRRLTIELEAVKEPVAV
jgi:hypothetical protein